MKRLPMTIGMLAAGLLVAVLPPAVASATTTDPTSSPIVDGQISIPAQHDLQTKMNRLQQLSKEATAAISTSTQSVGQMAKGLKDNS
jgi:hypothetical protein